MFDFIISPISSGFQYMINEANFWSYIVILAITIIVMFYGTRYLLTGVNSSVGIPENIPYQRCNVGLRAAVVSMKGHRQYMEDTYQAVPSFGDRENWSFYGVFDGHGGARCSVYVAHFLYKHVWSCVDLYLEHYSLNSKRLWKLLLNDENLVTITPNNNNNINNNNNPTTNSLNQNKSESDSANNQETETNNTNISNSIKSQLNSESLPKNGESNDINSNRNDLNETTILTSEAIKKLEKEPLLGNDNNNENDDNTIKQTKTLSEMSDRGSDVSDNSLTNLIKNNTKNCHTNEIISVRKKLIGIPKYVNEIMKEALIQSHRYADKEFLAMANRQQWQDGSTSISCVILPAKDILKSLMTDHRNGLSNDSNDSNKLKNKKNKSLYSVNDSNINQNSTNYHNPTIEELKNLTIDDICDDKDTWMFVANTGDSRAILVTKDGNAVELSHDHKPNRLDERKRIEQKGGRVVFFGVWRVEGVLAVSRAFGDRRLKRWVVPDPEVMSRRVENNDLFLILASDGVWDAVSNDQAARYAIEVWNDPVYQHADLKTKLQAIAGKISSMAFRHGSMDNITALVVHIPTHCTYATNDGNNQN